MTACHAIRPLLPARADELTLPELRTRAEHVAACTRCAAEAAAYTRLGQALSAMANLEADPADGTLERILVAIGRRSVVTGPRVLAAAGASGALVATVVVARAVRHRRHLPRSTPLRPVARLRPGVARLSTGVAGLRPGVARLGTGVAGLRPGAGRLRPGVAGFRPGVGRLRLPSLPAPTPALVRAK